MPAEVNGITMANIAEINGQTVSGGAYDPVADTGTYTETLPTSGLLKFGGFRSDHTNTSSVDTSDQLANYNFGAKVVKNFASDKDGHYIRVAETKSDFTIFTHGRYAMYGIDSSGRLWEAGASALYLHGSGTTDTFRQVTSVTGASDTGWTQIKATSDRAMGINGGKLFFIGANSYGQNGNGSTSANYNSFVQVGSETDWQDVRISRYWSIATKGSSNVVYTAGRNTSGQTGQGTTSGNTTSWTAIDDTNFTNTGTTFMLCETDGGMLITGGAVYAWGDEDSNQRLGTTNTSDVTTPVQTGKVSGSFATNWVDASMGNQTSFLVNTNGELWHHGSTGSGQYPKNFNGGTLPSNNRTGEYLQVGSDTDWARCECNSIGDTNSSMGFVGEKGNKLYFWGQNRYSNMIDDNTDSTQHGTVVLDQALATGNIWTTFTRTGSTNLALAAIY